MSQNLTDLAQAAIDALNAYTAERNRQHSEWVASKYAKAFNGKAFGISDKQEIELLTAIVDYDDDASGTLQELIWQTEWECVDNEADYRYEEMRSNQLLEG
jgi:hypothetical protein